MKKLAILLVLVLTLGGLGGAGWWVFVRQAPAQETAETTSEATEEPSLVAMLRFIELEPIVLPVIREGQITLHVTTVIAIELAEPMPKEQVRTISPRVRDTILSELHGLYGIRYVQERGFDLPVVRVRLRQAAERVLGPGTVTQALVKTIHTRVPSRG